MQKTRFTEEQMVTILREADQRPVPEVAKKHGVSSQTIYAWRKHFGSLEPTDIKRLRQLEQENGRLKKMVADRDLEIDVLKEITRKNGRRTPAPAAGRVCTLARAVRPPGVRRARRRPVDTRLPIASGGPGCPAAGRHASAGGAVSALRISPDSNLLETGGPRDEPGPHASTLVPGGAASAPLRPRRRVAIGRPRPLPASAANHVWAYDFLFDTCANGQTLKCLTVVDEWTRECLAIDVAGGIRSGRVIEVLTQLLSVHGAPRYLRSDNGPEFVAAAILRWLADAQIDTALIDPGKPWQNATDESFNGKFRDEFLSLQWFRNRVDAKVGIEQWRRHYNDVRPHSSLGYLTPLEFKAAGLAGCSVGRSPAEPARAQQEDQEPTTEAPTSTNASTGTLLQQ